MLPMFYVKRNLMFFQIFLDRSRPAYAFNTSRASIFPVRLPAPKCLTS
jgi:hypothetical protein